MFSIIKRSSAILAMLSSLAYLNMLKLSTLVLSRLHTTYIPAPFLGCTYSKLSGNFLSSGCTKTTPDSLEITNEVLLVFKDPVDDFGFSVGATDMLSTLKYKFN